MDTILGSCRGWYLLPFFLPSRFGPARAGSGGVVEKGAVERRVVVGGVRGERRVRIEGVLWKRRWSGARRPNVEAMFAGGGGEDAMRWCEVVTVQGVAVEQQLATVREGLVAEELSNLLLCWRRLCRLALAFLRFVLVDGKPRAIT